MPDINIERFRFYTNAAKKVHSTTDFPKWVKTFADLSKQGNQKVGEIAATGYNLIPAFNGAPFLDSEKRIFYTEYAKHPWHYGLILTPLEQMKLISPEQVDFHPTGVSVLYGGWDTKADKRSISRADLSGYRDSQMMIDYVATTVNLLPEANKIDEILDFLNSNTWRDKKGALPGSPAIPDIRLSGFNKTNLPDGFGLCTANVLARPEGRLLVLRDKTSFGGEWESYQVPVTNELIQYFRKYDVAA